MLEGPGAINDCSCIHSVKPHGPAPYFWQFFPRLKFQTCWFVSISRGGKVWDDRTCQRSQSEKETQSSLISNICSAAWVLAPWSPTSHMSQPVFLSQGVFNFSQKISKSKEQKSEWNYLVISGTGALTWSVKHQSFTKEWQWWRLQVDKQMRNPEDMKVVKSHCVSHLGQKNLCLGKCSDGWGFSLEGR